MEETPSAHALLNTDIHISATYRLTEALIASEKRMRRRIELLAEVVFETAADGRLTFLNRAWQDVLGYPLEDSLGDSLPSFVVEEDHATLSRILAGGCDLQAGERPQLCLRRANGGLAWMELSAVALEEGGFVGTLHDVTAQRVAQAELAKLSLVASFTDSLVIITDGRGAIEWVNRAFTEKTGTFEPP